MAADWLDVARYADSHGYQDDGMREMWPWRDWVIGAFNRNLPFDQFITWQLAGDLLPNATQEQRIATGFNRNHMQSQEGGIVPEEYRTEYVVDRVNTLGRVFLGLTVECARCHDHKYDPVTQKEFFRLYSFFNNVNENGQIPYSGVPSPTVMVTSPEQDATIAALAARIATLETELDPSSATYDAGFARWLAGAADAARAAVAKPAGADRALPVRGAGPGDRVSEAGSEEPAQAGRAEAEAGDAAGFRQPRGRQGARPRRRQGPADHDRARQDRRRGTTRRRQLHHRRRRRWRCSSATSRSRSACGCGSIAPARRVRCWHAPGGVMDGYRGYDILLRADGSLAAGLHHVGPDNEISIETASGDEAGHVAARVVTYDGSSRAAGIGLFVDGARAAATTVMDHLRRSIVHDRFGKNWTGSPPIRIGRRGDETLDDVSVDDLRVYDRQLSRLESQALAGAADPLGDVLKAPAASRTLAQRRRCASTTCSASIRRTRQRWRR